MKDRVDIHDRLNNRWLLGSIERRHVRPRSAMSIAICSPFNARSYKPDDLPEPVSIRRVDFTFGWVEAPDGWSMHRVLLTDAPLSDLLDIDDFRLPGESAEQAAYRRYYRGAF